MPCFESPSRQTWRWHGWISVHARALHRHTTRHVTSCTHFDWIFELMRSLRCNYALYRDTMPLNIAQFYITVLQEGLNNTTVAEKDIAAAVVRSAAAIAAAIIARRGRVRKMCVNLELLYYSNKKWAVEELDLWNNQEDTVTACSLTNARSCMH